jgi:hypothetical protein
VVPSDNEGAQRIDDGSIPDGERLWRRLLPDWIVWTEPGGPRCSSAAFKDRHTGEVSVFRASLTTEDAVLRDHPDDSLGEIDAGAPRGLGYKVVPDPDPGDPGAAHAIICPSPKGASASKMAKATRLVVLRPRGSEEK